MVISERKIGLSSHSSLIERATYPSEFHFELKYVKEKVDFNFIFVMREAFRMLKPYPMFFWCHKTYLQLCKLTFCSSLFLFLFFLFCALNAVHLNGSFRKNLLKILSKCNKHFGEKKEYIPQGGTFIVKFKI